MAHFILSYESGTVGHLTEEDEGDAIVEAVGRCNAIMVGGNVLDERLNVVATIKYDPRVHLWVRD